MANEHDIPGDDTPTQLPAQVLIAPTDLPPAAVLRQFAASARHWVRVHECLQFAVPEAHGVLLNLIKHFGCELLIANEGIMVHTVLRHVLDGFELGQENLRERERSFLKTMEDGLLALPGFSLRSPGVVVSAWTPMHQASFDTWRGDIPIHLLTIHAGDALNRDQARSLAYRLGAKPMYEYVASGKG